MQTLSNSPGHPFDRDHGTLLGYEAVRVVLVVADEVGLNADRIQIVEDRAVGLRAQTALVLELVRLRTIAGGDAVLALHVDQRTAIAEFVLQSEDLFGFTLDDAFTEIGRFDIWPGRGPQKERQLDQTHQRYLK